MKELPEIPETITIHLGKPTDKSAENLTINFVDYIKNVASSENYPTWPENAIRAMIYAHISFALNRVFTDWYRSQGYDFDITSLDEFDQEFIKERAIFENISKLVDELFNNYIAKGKDLEPYLAKQCEKEDIDCKDGLSLWEAVELANKGLSAEEILKEYYGEDITIVEDAPVTKNVPSYPGEPIGLGAQGNDVKKIQMRLNLISTDYPELDKIYPENGVFDLKTEKVVRQFQEIFDLPLDGVVDKATWYKIIRVYNNVKQIGEIGSQGFTLSEESFDFPEDLQLEMSGSAVEILQYMLNVVRLNYPQIPEVPIDGFFGETTQEAVKQFQLFEGLKVNGIVDQETWNHINQVYQTFIDAQCDILGECKSLFYQGRVLMRGISGEDVKLLQEYLNEVQKTYNEIPLLVVTGYFGDKTRDAVMIFQKLYELDQTGVVAPITWDKIANVYVEIKKSAKTSPEQFPGYEIGGEA